MSTVNVNRVVDASGGVLAPISSVHRNRIINGSCTIDQRNAGASVTASTTAALVYTLDRFYYFASAASKFTVQQNAGAITPPAGFTNYLGVTSSSAYTAGAAESFSIGQPIEGFNIADFGWGTANAKTVTLSFWVRSSLVGTFGGSLRNSAVNRSYPFTYTISAANTWEQKSVTIAGDTSGTWLTNNGAGIYLAFSLGSGSTVSGTAGAWAAGNFVSATGATSVVGTNGATLYITGVQLEVGTQATSFEYRQYQQELALCQRYYYKISGGAASRFGVGHNSLTTAAVVNTTLPVTMRIAPTALEQSGTAGDYDVQHGNTVTVCSSVPTFSICNPYMATVVFPVASGLTAGQGSNGRAVNTSAFLAWSAEL
jgi:hypothetical protein